MANDPTDTTKFPLGTSDWYAAARNAGDFDKGMNAGNTTFVNRFGKTLPTFEKAISDAKANYGGLNNRGDWVTSTNYAVNDLWQSTVDNTWYLVLTAYTSGASEAVDIATGNVQVFQSIEKVNSIKIYGSSLSSLISLCEAGIDNQSVVDGDHVLSYEYAIGDGGGLLYSVMKAVDDASRPSIDGSAGIVEYLSPSISEGWYILANKVDYLTDRMTGGNLLVSDKAAAFYGVEFWITGNHTITVDTEFSSSVAFKGGRIIDATGVTVSFSQEFKAGVEWIFEFSDTTVIDVTAKNSRCYLEWFGAVGNVASSQLPAFNLALQFKKLELLPVTYYVDGTFTIGQNINNFWMMGGGTDYRSEGLSTRIINMSPVEDTIQIIGESVATAAISEFNTEIKLEDFELTRLNLTTPVSGSEATGAKGISAENTLFLRMNRVKCSENYIGYYLSGTVKTVAKDCKAFRSPAVTVDDTNSNDKFFGFWLNGAADIGLAGGNASTFLIRPNAEVGGMNFDGAGGAGNLREMFGYYCNNNFVDTFMMFPECVNCNITIDGTGSSSIGNVDFNVVGAIVDGFQTTYGISVANTNATCNVKITEPYAASASTASAPSATAAIFVNLCAGSVTVDNPDVTLAQHSSCIGVYVSASTMFSGRGGCINNSARPVVVENSSYCNIEYKTNNAVQTTTQAAVWVIGSTGCYIRPQISGSTDSVVTAGVQLLGVSNDNEVNTTAIYTGAISPAVKYLNSGSGTGNIQSGVA